LEAAVAIAVDAALAAPLAHAPTLSQMAADPSRPDLEAPSVAPAILNPEAKLPAAHLRLQAWPGQSAPEWRLRRYRPSTERARLTEEPLRDPLERSSDNPDS
jgi:Flp pilus assembly protein CpaB